MVNSHTSGDVTFVSCPRLVLILYILLNYFFPVPVRALLPQMEAGRRLWVGPNCTHHFTLKHYAIRIPNYNNTKTNDSAAVPPPTSFRVLLNWKTHQCTGILLSYDWKSEAETNGRSFVHTCPSQLE